MGKFIGNNMQWIVVIAVVGVAFLAYKLYKKDDATGTSILGK